MAICALEHGIVIRVRMANGTNAVGASMIRVKPRVIESGAKPTGGYPRCVASRACCGESGSGVIRICRPGIIGLVAGIAIRRGPGKDAADMA